LEARFLEFLDIKTKPMNVLNYVCHKLTKQSNFN